MSLQVKRKQKTVPDFARFDNYPTKLCYVTQPLARVHNCQRQMSSGRISLGFWGWMSSMGPGEIVEVSGRMNGHQYMELLRDVFLPIVRLAYPEGTIYLAQDNSAIHRSQVVQEWLTSHYGHNIIINIDDMAVYAAHLTRTLQETPSIFQITAQESLGATVKPALRRVLEYLADVYPQKIGWAVPWFDELYLLIDCCLQYYYLKHFSASFSESFYGLLRVPINVSNEFNTGQRLPEFLEKASLILLVLVPYVRDKVERLIEQWRQDEEDGRLGKDTKGSARRAAVRVYSVAHAAWCVCNVVQTARFLCGGSRSPTPPLAALRLALVAAPEPPEPHTPPQDGLLTFPVLGGALLRAVEYGAFAVQFLRWWDTTRPHTTQLPPPPTPQKDEQVLRWTNKCPECLQPWRNPTALSVSGLVYCYSCAARRVTSLGACATGLPANREQLVRLYLSEGSQTP